MPQEHETAAHAVAGLEIRNFMAIIGMRSNAPAKAIAVTGIPRIDTVLYDLPHNSFQIGRVYLGKAKGA